LKQVDLPGKACRKNLESLTFTVKPVDDLSLLSGGWSRKAVRSELFRGQVGDGALVALNRKDTTPRCCTKAVHQESRVSRYAWTHAVNGFLEEAVIGFALPHRSSANLAPFADEEVPALQSQTKPFLRIKAHLE
jgi:hypothetical protein